MLKKMILDFSGPKPDASFRKGYCLPEHFELPENILIFMHDWYPNQTFVHTRYMLIIPAVPIEYRIDNDICYRINPGQAMFSQPCQNRTLLPTYNDEKHGYPRLMITFELTQNMYYLPENLLLNITPQCETYLHRLLEAYTNEHNADISVNLFFLLRELSRNYADTQPIRYSAEVTLALQCITCKTAPTLAELAAHAKTGVSNLRFRFKQELGTSPGAFIASHRLKIAEYHLAMTNMRIEEITQLCKFQSSYAFSHFFKKHKGISPLAWRKIHKKQNFRD